MRRPREVACDQCGRVCKVIAVSIQPNAETAEIDCLIECPECGRRTVKVSPKSN